jgi:hypothetical protein
VLLAALCPTGVGWVSRTPYRDTLAHLVDGQEGTGRGRLIQYAATVRMIAAHPILGVAPGNWSTAYPTFAGPGDPSYEPRSIRPVPRLPNSDVLGGAAERGLPVALLALAAAVLALRRVGTGLGGPPRGRLDAAALLAVFSGVLVMGSVDAVLLRPDPLALVCIAAGVLLPRSPRSSSPLTAVPACAVGAPPRPGRRWVCLPLAAAGSACGLLLSLAQLRSLQLRARPDLERLARAATLDPGEYSLHTEIAFRAAGSGACALALRSLARAGRLFPLDDDLLAAVHRRCGVAGSAPARRLRASPWPPTSPP